MSIKISIIVPCYNQAQYLDECLQSVLNQTFQDWECIIVNDGSPDNTEEIVQEWIKKDSRFKYLYKPNGGLSSARNAGIAIATSIYILPLDADDKIGIDYIKLAVQSFQKDDSLKIVYCKAEKFGVENGVWKLKPFSLPALASENIIFCSAIFKKSDWERVGGYDENLLNGLEDWEFWIAVLKNGGAVLKLSKIHFYYRTKEISMLNSLSKKEVTSIIKYINIKHADFFVEQFGNFNDLIKQNQYYKQQDFRLLTNKKKALKVLLHAFFGINYFKS